MGKKTAFLGFWLLRIRWEAKRPMLTPRREKATIPIGKVTKTIMCQVKSRKMSNRRETMPPTRKARATQRRMMSILRALVKSKADFFLALARTANMAMLAPRNGRPRAPPISM